MGFRVALVAVRGIRPDEIYARYGLRRTGQYEEIAESPICASGVTTGWHLLYLNEYHRPHSELLAKLSQQAEVLFCDVNETCMSSFATSWVDGIEQWTVFHDSGQSLTHVASSGVLPNSWPAIVDAQLRKQSASDDVDHVFDAPIQLFEQLTGIHYAKALPGPAEDRFEVMAPRR